MALQRRGPAQIIEGKLEAHPFAEVVSQLYRESATGILLVHRGGEEKKVCFQDGQVVYASSSNKVEKLGFLLVEEGVIGREDLLAAAKDNRDLRTFLVEEGRMASEEFDDAMCALVTDIVAGTFAWADGEFSFVEKDSIDIPGQVEGVPMPDLFLEGARCIPEEERIRSALGDGGAKIHPGTDEQVLEQEINLEPSEDLVLSGIDGTSSLDEVVSRSMMGPDMTRRFLYGLVLSGHLEVEGRQPKGLPRAVRRSRLAARRKGARRRVRRSVMKARRPAPARPASAGGAKPVQGEASTPPAAESFEEAVERLYLETGREDHYAVLGVQRGAEANEIRSRYYELARSYHPDKLGPSAPDDLREKLETLFGRLGEAYNVLQDPERRKEYDHKLASGEVSESAKKVDPQAVARESFERGLGVLQAGDAQAAARFFQYATSTDPSKGEYWYHLGLALSGLSTTRKQAEEAFLTALKKDPSNYRVYLQLGLLYKAGGLRSRAADMLRKGLQWEPENAKMLKALAELEAEDPSRGGGGLGGLFRKKG